MATITLDLTGLKCPLPVLHTRKALLRLRTGDRLQVLCSDPMAAVDIPVLVQSLAMSISDSRNESGALTFLIETTVAAG